MHLQAAVARFLSQLRADGRSQHTMGQYRRHLAEFTAWALEHGLEAVRDVAPEHIAE